MKRRVWAVGLLLASMGSMGQAGAQPLVPPEVLERTLTAGENRLRFCVGAQSYLRDFEIELANELAETLLLEPVIYEYPALSVRPYDYTIGHAFEDVFVLLTNECDVFMGMSLAGDPVGDWMEFSQPVYETRFVLVALSGSSLTSLDQGGSETEIGTRLGSEADLRLSTYLRSLPDDRRMRRFPFNDYRVLFDNLVQGTIDVALVWEPALRGLAGEFEAANDLVSVDMGGFQDPKLAFGFAYLRGNTFVRDLIDESIDALKANGVIDRLVEQYVVP